MKIVKKKIADRILLGLFFFSMLPPSVLITIEFPGKEVTPILVILAVLASWGTFLMLTSIYYGICWLFHYEQPNFNDKD